MEHNGKEFTVREIPLEEGFKFIQGDGEVDMAGMLRAAILIDGEPAQEGEIPLSVGMKLTDEVMAINGLSDEGKG